LGIQQTKKSIRNVRPEPPLQGGEARDGRARTFSQDYRPCGQPVAEGGSGRLRPVPPQAGHFKRMNAMPSDFPFRSTGFATYPVPPQFGQSFGLTLLPLIGWEDFRRRIGKVRGKRFCVTNREQESSRSDEDLPRDCCAKEWNRRLPTLSELGMQPERIDFVQPWLALLLCLLPASGHGLQTPPRSS